MSNTILADLDADHRYNAYIVALETVRLAFAASEVQFYRDLLATPLVQRPILMLIQASRLPLGRRYSVLRIVSAANAALKQML